MIQRAKNKIIRMKNEHKLNIRLEKTIEQLKKNGINFVFVEPPYANKIRNLTTFEKERIDNWVFDFNKIEKNMDYLKKLYGDNVDESYIKAVYEGGIVVNDGYKKKLLDFSNDYVNIYNGMRKTVFQPQKFYGGIHVYGTCIVRGTGVKDEETIASFLQKKVNEVKEDSYRVFNHGIGRGSRLCDDLDNIDETLYKKGDIVVVINFVNKKTREICLKYGAKYIETSFLFNRPNDTLGEWFTDEVVHTNSVGNEIIAAHIFDNIKQFLYNKENDLQYNPEIKIGKDKVNDISHINPELKNYIQKISKYRINDKNVLIGSIVMNCNPFTNGHRYLIETASKQVDYLYIFVVEENKSFFSFEDRFKLVKEGTKDLKNVIVLPSGNFIISAITFPGYFLKEQDKEMQIDASGDIEIFGKYICPALNISIRFAGEEPIDKVTRQYNRTMEEYLPNYGVRFIEIKRKTYNEEVISASRVRKCMEDGNLKEIKNLVPAVTYNYLEKKMENEQK